MKPVIIIAIAFVVLVSIPVFAQEESLSELKARLDAENLQRAQEAGSIVSPSSPGVPSQESFKKIDCPSGYTERAVSGGEIICVNEATGQELGDSAMIDLDNTLGYVIIGVIIFVIIIAGIAKAASKSESYKDVERADFTRKTKDHVMELQHGRCAECKKFPRHWEFDHIDSRGDNSIENCQGLCRDCHQDKTLEDNVRHRDSEDD